MKFKQFIKDIGKEQLQKEEDQYNEIISSIERQVFYASWPFISKTNFYRVLEWVQSKHYRETKSGKFTIYRVNNIEVMFDGQHGYLIKVRRA